MKKIIFLACSFVFCIIQNAVADDAAFSAAPAPAQSYHTAQSASVSQTVPQQNDAASTPQTPLSTASIAAAPSPKPIDDTTAIVDSSSQDQIQLVESQKQLARRVQDLSASNQAIGAAIQSIDQSLTQLQQEINAISKQQALEQQQLQIQAQSQPKNNLLPAIHFSALFAAIIAETKTPMGLGVIAAIVLGCALMVTRIIMRRADERAFSSGKTVRTAQEKMTRADALLDEDTKNEYDFMGTREAIPAKLDLARSYMAMNDHDQAYAILKTVMELGNENQRTEAQLLIQKIVKKK